MTGPVWLDAWLSRHGAELVAVRRDIHAHPELSRSETRTTGLLQERLEAAGLRPQRLPAGTGLICDIGDSGPTVALRADIDALPLQDTKSVPYRSTVDGVCHACGHDVHATALLGAALACANAPELPGRIRIVFQPAEEVIPGGALDVIAAGGLEQVSRIFALHCDPRLPVGKVGIRTGPITAASDRIEVVLSGPGGHTSRPHITVDVVHALGRVITEVPGLLSRLVDPRSGMSLVWGAVNSGLAFNIIPQHGTVRGTVRVLDRDAWHGAEKVIRRIVEEVAAPSGAQVDVRYVRGLPPVVNEAVSTSLLRDGVVSSLGTDALADTAQSMGGEDFGWYLDTVPGALARLGVNGTGTAYDLHQGGFDVDEAAIGNGVRVLVGTALAALR